jgi:predicted transcriptional regulator
MRHKLPAQLVRQVRETVQLSQRELAQRARTAQSVVARIELGETDPSWHTLSRVIGAAGYELRADLRKKPMLDKSELDDIPRILKLTPEERLLEVAALSRFIAGAKRV